MPELKFSNFSSTEFTTVTWSFPTPSTNSFNLHLGYGGPNSSLTQSSGNILLKNLRLYTTGTTSTLSARLTVQEDAIFSRTLTATQFASTSDIKIKDNIQDASLDNCMALLNNVNPKIYNRTDMPGSPTRLGFIAQDLESHIVPEFANLLGVQYGGAEPLLTVDYSRLCCVLWGIVGGLQAARDTSRCPGSEKKD